MISLLITTYDHTIQSINNIAYITFINLTIDYVTYHQYLPSINHDIYHHTVYLVINSHTLYTCTHDHLN